jgi:hypothetical protein
MSCGSQHPPWILSRLYHQELNKRDSPVPWLHACVEECKNTTEAKKAGDILVRRLQQP